MKTAGKQSQKKFKNNLSLIKHMKFTVSYFKFTTFLLASGTVDIQS